MIKIKNQHMTLRLKADGRVHGLVLLQIHEKTRSLHADATRNVVEIIWRHYT